MWISICSICRCSPGSRMLLILRCAHAFGLCGALTHIRPGFCVAVIVGVAEVVDMRPGVDPNDGIGGAVRPCQYFSRILVAAESWPLARAVESIRQARPTSAFGGRRGRSSTLRGRLRARIAVREARATRTISARGSWSRLRRVGARPEIGKARTTSATRRPGRRRRSLRRRRIGTVITVGQARTTGTLRGCRRRVGQCQYGE